MTFNVLLRQTPVQMFSAKKDGVVNKENASTLTLAKVFNVIKGFSATMECALISVKLYIALKKALSAS